MAIRPYTAVSGASNAQTDDSLSQFAATTSTEMRGIITDETGTGAAVFATSPTLVTPNLGTPSALVGTNITGTAAGLTAGNVTTNANLTGHVTSTGNAAVLGSFTVAQLNAALSDGDVATGGGTATGTNTGDQTNISGNAATVTTNANLTGPITSVGNTTSVASQTGTGSTFVMSAGPTFTGTISSGGPLQLTTVDASVTAFAGGGQTNATALSASATFHRISTCATAGDSVKLPISGVGLCHYIKNDGVADCQVYGTPAATINGIATATGVTLSPGVGAWFTCVSTAEWRTSDLARTGTGAVVVRQTSPTIITPTISGNAIATGTLTFQRNDPNNYFEFDPQGGSGAQKWWVGATRSGSGIAPAGYFFIWNESDTLTRAFCTDAGYWGFGTFPSAKVPVVGLEVSGTAPNDAAVCSTIFSDTASSQFIGRRARGTTTSPTQLLADDPILVISSRPYHSGAAFATAGRASINMVAAEDQTSSAQGSYISLSTTNIGTNSRSEKFRLTDVGTVGIGVTAPTAVLHLKAGSATANTGPLKFTAGTLLTTPEAGAREYNGNHYLTNGQVRFPVGGALFGNYADVSVGGAETDIYSNTLAASTLANNGDTVTANYGGNFVLAGTEAVRLKVYFGGSAVYDSEGIYLAAGTTSWHVRVEIIRVSSTVIRYTASLITTNATNLRYCFVGELTGLTLSNTNILKITGTSSDTGSGVGDIVGKMATVKFAPSGV